MFVAEYVGLVSVDFFLEVGVESRVRWLGEDGFLLVGENLSNFSRVCCCY